MTIDIDKLKAEYRLEDTVERLTGQQITKHKISCPLHEDKTPSMHIYDDGRFHCYACGAHGDVLDFVGIYLYGRNYNSDAHFKDVIDHLGGVDIKPIPRTAPSTRRPKKPGLSISAVAVDNWNLTMPDDRREFWHSRWLRDDVIDFYKLGWDGRRYTIPLAYRGVYFGVKRRKADDVDDGIEAKYMMSKGSRAGLFPADCLFTAQHVIICEGEIDALLIRQADLDAVTTTAGAGSWKPQWARFFSHIPRITILYDNDDAGREGALKVRKSLRKAEIATLPEGVNDVGDLHEIWGIDDATAWLRTIGAE